MKKLLLLFISILLFTPAKLFAAENPDTVKVGVYIISLHDIDFREKEYTVRFWLWMSYRNSALNFAKNIEVPNAKSLEISDCTIDSSNGEVNVLMKIKCTMKESWQVHNYPFDKQKLEVHIENSQFDVRSLVFIADTLGKHYDPKFTISGWNINHTDVSTGFRSYETSFGDATLKTPHSEYASFNIDMFIERNAWGLFFKLFIGMYVSFLISYICFFIHGDNIDSRFGLSVGALFAAVGNKYIIDSILPESSTFTLVDSLHAFTFISILVTILFAIYALRLTKKGKLEKANRVDKFGARFLLFTYLLLNIIYVARAIWS
jgi:hypothetical protein